MKKKKSGLNAYLVLFLVLFAGAMALIVLTQGSGGGNIFNPAKNNPAWGKAVQRANLLMQVAGGTPNLQELLMAKYQDIDALAAYLLHDETGGIARNLLEESQEELRVYQSYINSKYLYTTRIESNCLAIYQNGACVATIPLPYVNSHS